MKWPSKTPKKAPDVESDEISKLKQQLSETTEKLTLCQNRFDALMANSLDAMALFDKDFNILYRSPTGYKLSGWTHEEMADRTLAMNTHPDDQAMVRGKLSEALISHGEPVYLSFRMLHKLGHYIWVEGSFRNMLETKGVNAIVLSIRDITSRKQSELKTAESEEQFRTLIERISDAFIAFDKNLRYTYVNKKAGEITHKDPKDMIGKYVWDVFPDAIGTSTYEAFQQAMKDQVYLCNTDYYEPLNLWQENHLYPSENGLSVFIRDISERKRAEKKLVESEQRFRTLIENSSDAIVLTDENSKVIYQSPSVERITGISMAYRQANPDTSFAHPDDKQHVADIVNNSKRNPGIPIFFQSRMHHLTGKYIWIEGFITNQLKDPNVKAMVINYRDVSERKNSEDEILKLNNELEGKVIQRTQQLEALNKELESFTYSVSHDLRAPLRIIDGFSNILMEDLGEKLEPSSKRSLEVIVKNARRMGMLIDDLLNFSKVGKTQIQVSNVKMNTLVAEALEEIALSDTVIPKNMKIEALKPAKGDARLLKQVWINLISNAIKYSSKKENPEIVIDSYEENNRVVFFIKDNGVGFDMQYAHKLFGVFQRLHKLDEFEGTGVGLALTQRIIARHEGTVWAEGKINEGATFYFSLPM